MQPSLLVVEDDETIRETVRDALELEGFAVVACGNGRDALQILQRAPEGEGFSLVVLDLMLPGLGAWMCAANCARATTKPQSWW